MRSAVSQKKNECTIITSPEDRTIRGGSLWARFKRLIVGRALRSEQAIHERLTKKVALAVFSSDALSSTAYASEEILLVLAAAFAFKRELADL